LAGALALALVSVLSGCGGGDSDTTTAQQNLGPPKASEDVDQAEKRIAKTLASGDCKRINELNPPSRPSLNTKQRCTYLRRLAGLEAVGARAYGDDAAVIDYALGARTYSAILIRDEEGLFHIAFFNPFGVDKAVGTKYAEAFDSTARRTLAALKDRDCKAFEEVAFVRFGLGSQDDQTICDYVENNPIANQLEDFPDAEFKAAGGNADYAFYTLATPATRWIMVFAREADRAGQPAALDLPPEAPTYGYVGAYLTGSRGSDDDE
jgi:hypothetical protein